MARQAMVHQREMTAASGRRLDVDRSQKIGIVTAQYLAANILQQYLAAVRPVRRLALPQ
jgi:hypothetical protein